MENYHLSIHMAFWKESMINRLSNLINRNRSAAKISQVLCSSQHPPAGIQLRLQVDQVQIQVKLVKQVCECIQFCPTEKHIRRSDLKSNFFFFEPGYSTVSDLLNMSHFFSDINHSKTIVTQISTRLYFL